MKFSIKLFLTTYLSLMASPSWAAYNVYVVNTEGNNISYFPSTNPLEQGIFSIPTSNGPYGLTITPDGLTAYVANSLSNTIVFFPLSDPNNYQQIPGFFQPVSIAITPDGLTAYVANISNGTITSFPLENPNDQTIISGFSHPGDLAITPDGLTMYVTDVTANAIVSFPLSDPSTITTLPTAFPSSFGDEGPGGIAITSDGLTVYVTPNDCDATAFISFPINDPSDVRTISIAPYHPAGYLDIPPDADIGYVGLGAGICFGTEIGSFPLSDPSNITRISGFNAPSGIATSTVPLPARNLSASQKRNQFAFESELFNQLQWEKSFGTITVAYNVYRNGTLIGTVSAGKPLRFQDHNRKPKVSYFYEVISINDQGIEGQATALTFP